MSRTRTKPKINNQLEASMVKHLFDIGCTDGSYFSVNSTALLPDNRERLVAILNRFGCYKANAGFTSMGWDGSVNQALIDAYNEWVQAHQED